MFNSYAFNERQQLNANSQVFSSISERKFLFLFTWLRVSIRVYVTEL